MTYTYTSADLAEIAASIPSRASEASLVIIPGVNIEKDVDVQVDSQEAPGATFGGRSFTGRPRSSVCVGFTHDP